jgi:phosphatidylglycerol:prolipoprotein diacylglycerol transferase
MHRVAFEIAGWSIHWYGILVVAGFVAGLWTASRRGLRHGLAAETVADVGFWLMVGAIAGARLFHVVSYWREDYAGRPVWEVFAIHHGGLVFYGGLAGASLATILYARANGVRLWNLADALAPSIALGQAIGRIGCWTNGCCYGRITDLPWAIRFSADHATGGAGVHPTQFYEAGLDLLLYAGLALLHRHRRFEGQVFAGYLMAYAVLRFGVEFWRGDYNRLYLGGWATPGQVVGLLVLAAGIWLYRRGSGAVAAPAADAA